MLTAARRRTCNGCGDAVPIRLIPPRVPGAVAVNVIDCGMCDRRQCNSGNTGCKAYVADRRAKRCPKGHLL